MEMVGKSARAGIELIAAVSAPTSLALRVAARCGITLCSFVRETRATVFTHPERVTGATEALREVRVFGRTSTD
jgi:FdhD protein